MNTNKPFTIPTLLRVFLVALLLPWAGLTAQESSKVEGSSKRPVQFVIRLPADAELEMMGKKMDGTGEARRYRTAPIEINKLFKYTIRATWNANGKPQVAERTPYVSGGQSVEVEFREFEISKDEQAVVDLVNATRAEKEMGRLEPNPRLVRAARQHAANMAKQQVLEHTLDGKDIWKRIEEEGYSPSAAAENIGEGPPTPEIIVELWMQSQGHRHNILNPAYREIGVGVAVSENGERYWVQVFASPFSTNVNEVRDR